MKIHVCPVEEAPMVANADGRELARVLDGHAISTVFQPLVELDTGAVLGFEALSRGPRGSALESPDMLFAAARAHDRLVELDRLCRQKSVLNGAALGHGSSLRLFVNTEVGALAIDEDAVSDTVQLAHDLGVSVVLELTERDLVVDPSRLLRAVAHVRACGWGIALDDVGADQASLALLPLLAPDVIKLDLHLVQARPDRDLVRVLNAVHAAAERSGAVLLAEGIETERHIEIALSFGATVGQGYLLGRPGPLPMALPAAPTAPIRIRPVEPARVRSSPFAIAAACRPVRLGRKPLLIEVSKLLESQATGAFLTALVLSTFQTAEFFTPATARRYAAIERGAAFVGAFGVGMPITPVPGVRGASLDPDDVLAGEWDVAVLGSHFAAALVARDLGDQGPDADRRFEFVLTHDRDLVIEIVGALMARIDRAEISTADCPDAARPDVPDGYELFARPRVSSPGLVLNPVSG